MRGQGRGILVALLLASVFLRFWRLGYPAEKVFDETHYVYAAAVMAGLEKSTGMEAWATSDTPIIARTPDPNFSHPPLAKALMVLSIKAFGNEPWAWRFPSAVLGVVSLILFFWLSLRLTKDPWVAGMAAFFMSFDMMHICQSRIAMLDILLLTSGLMLMGALVLLLDNPRSRWGNIGAILAVGIGLSTKLTMVLTCVAFGISLIVLGKERNWWQRGLHALGIGVGGVLLFNLCSIYFIAHGFSWTEWVELQWVSVVKVLGPLKAHPYSSMPISWPFNHKPVWYYYKGGDTPEGIVALGNPVLWWGFLWALSELLFERRVRDSKVPNFVLLWYALTYLPLILVLWRRSDASFLFHMLPSTPPMYLGLAYALNQKVPDRRWQCGFGALVIVVFAYFFPVTYALPMPGSYYSYLSHLISF